MRTVKTTLVILLVIGLGFMFDAVSDLYADEIMIGTEGGPSTIWFPSLFINQGTSKIRAPHPVFNDSNFFYASLPRGGFDYVFEERQWLDMDVTRYPDILADLDLQCLPMGGIINVFDANDTLIEKFNVGYAWKSDWSGGAVLINDVNFFQGELGNALYLDSPYDDPDSGDVWIANQTHNGYIIGPCAAVPRWKAFSGQDSRKIEFSVRKLNDCANGNDPILTFKLRYTNSDTDTVSYVLTSDDLDTTWQWITFDTDDIEFKSTYAKFWLQWHGNPDAGEVLINKIKYESYRHSCIFDDYSDDIDTDSDHFRNWMERWAVFNRRLCRTMIGWICKEPYPYAFETYRVLADYFDNSVSLNLNFQNVNPVNYTYTAEFPFTNGEDIGDFIDDTDVNALYFDQFCIWWNINRPDSTDWWHWEKSYDGLDELGEVDVQGISIQDAWDEYINGHYYPDEINGFNNHGIRYAAEAARTKGIPLHAGIQSSGWLKWNNDDEVWDIKGFGEPTPRMIKCQGFLAMTFGAKGFLYSYYAPFYSKKDGDYFADPPFSHPRFEYMNGASCSGLVTLCQDTSDKDDHLMEEVDLFAAASMLYMLEDQTWERDGFELGWLWESPKWDAAKEFNDYIHSIDATLARLRWNYSECAAEAENEDIDFVHNITSKDSVLFGQEWAWTTDLRSNTWVQVGTFTSNSIRYFALVNRRCYGDGSVHGHDDRTVNCELHIAPYNHQFTVRDVATGDIVASGIGDDIDFQYWLKPAEGRLFMVMDNFVNYGGNFDSDTTISGVVFIDTTIYVNVAARLTISPGAQIMFSDEGKLIVNGALTAIGKPDSTGDSTIVFTCLNSDKDGLVKLMGSSGDSLIHCKFTHLEKGLNISKSTGNSTYIENSEFSYCKEEGIFASGGNITIENCNVHNNGSDGGYFYNCYACIDSSTFQRSKKSGLYVYNVDASSYIKHSDFNLNATSTGMGPQAGVRYFGCSPKFLKSASSFNGGYGIYGANGSYPILYSSTENAANITTDNSDHETYWDNSYPILDYGHNNFNTEDDTIIYITGTTLDTFFAQRNYWGSDDPDTTLPLVYGPNTVIYTPTDGAGQYGMLEREEIGNLLLDPDPGNRISENSLQAQNDLRNALAVEDEHPREAIDEYRRIIIRHPGSAAAPVALDRLFWLIRRQFEGDERDNQLSDFNRYSDNLARTCPARGLAWKARRIALWAMAALHRYDEAIRGFEEIVRNHDCLADSIFAVIDIGTLHLEAEEWRRRDPQNRQQAVPGRYSELCPADFPTHREHTDELLAMLTGDAYKSPPMIPEDYFLAQNYPNPFNATTKIRYGLPEDGLVRIAIYDLMGRRVRTLLNESMRAGYHTMIWDGKTSTGTQVSSGLYFYRIQAGRFTKVKKMTMMK
ncbi:MAG: T9SS type A sorting domain-containing protein [Candidatus Hatepunaea meridiana]|nr:T9SS type A sorting domain-containing protein [Candidatus Hatepunaea meridiana]